jgi:hypothetical protein
MATPGQLVRTMADVLGIPSATVAQYDRQLAEAGLRTTGGRGTSAAKVTAIDAANLLITILGSPVSGPSIKAATQTCETFGSLLVEPNFSDTHKFKQFGLSLLARVPKKHTFRDALATLIEGASHGEFFRIISGDNVFVAVDDFFGVRVESMHPRAEIFCEGFLGVGNSEERGRLIYSPPQPPRKRHAPASDLSQTRRITFLTLRLLGYLIASAKA